MPFILGNNLHSQEKLPEHSKARFKFIIPIEKEAYMLDIPFYSHDRSEMYFEKLEGKPSLITFWATWSAASNKHIISLDNLKKDFRKIPLNIISISEDYTPLEAATNFYKKYNIRNLEIYYDKGNSLMKNLQIAGLPFSYILNSEGQIIGKIPAEVNFNDDNLRKELLEFIKYDGLLPKNSYKDSSLLEIPVKK